jgi:hypothetical protein
MESRTIKRFAALGLAVAPLLLAVPASAATPATTAKPVVFKTGAESGSERDGVCPDKPLDGDPANPPVEELNQIFSAAKSVKVAPRQYVEETIGVSICWANSSALGGDFVDRGTFSYSIGSVTTRGTVSGSESYSDANPFQLTLTVRSSTPTPTAQTMAYVGCQPGGPNMVSKLRINPLPNTPAPRLPAACTAPTRG